MPSAAMFNELLQLFFSFGLTLPPEFSTFFRAMITLEGTLSILSPGFLASRRRSRRRGVDPGAVHPRVDGGDGEGRADRVAPLLRRLPRHVDRVATIVERGDLRARISLFATEEDVRVVTRLLNRVLLAFLGGVVGFMSVILLGCAAGPSSPAGRRCTSSSATSDCSAARSSSCACWSRYLHDGLTCNCLVSSTGSTTA